MRLSKKRARYYEMIRKYKERREAIRIKYPPERLYPFKRGWEYNRAIWRINKKIKLWSRQIKKIDMISNKIIALGNVVAYFTGINPKGLNKANRDKRSQRALMIFYRKGIELGIEQKLLREYVGMKRVAAPAEYRKKHLAMTNANKSALYSHDAWIEWKRFVKHYSEWPITSSDFLDKRKAPGA